VHAPSSGRRFTHCDSRGVKRLFAQQTSHFSMPYTGSYAKLNSESDKGEHKLLFTLILLVFIILINSKKPEGLSIIFITQHSGISAY
jgi:hypothetical protein